MTVEVHMFSALNDNYGFLLHDDASQLTACIDTPEVEPINAALAEKGWKLTHIFNTHHHFDHAGGNEALKAQWHCKVVGAAVDAQRIPGIDIKVTDREIFQFGSSRVQVLEVPGHTSGHIAYYLPDDGIVFVGDTLFALGCGRLFEGSPQQMWQSLGKLMALPDETVVYCAHEYTASNAAFAVTVEPDNAALRQRVKEITALRAAGKPTVPTTIGLEKATNPFLRPASADLQQTLGMTGDEPVAVFAETRRRKDHF